MKSPINLAAAITVLAAVAGCILLLPGWAQPDVDAPARANATEVSSSETESLRIVYFNSPTCQECEHVRQSLPGMLEAWGRRVALESYDLEEIGGFDELFAYEDHYHVEVTSPVIFVGDEVLMGAREILSRLPDVIAEQLAAGGRTFLPQAEEPAEVRRDADDLSARLVERFEGFNAGAVAAAGLIDGINPCAFTTIVFMLSMLAHLGRSRRQLAVVGAGFTAAIFVTYLLLGLGIFRVIKSFSVSHGLSTAITCAVALLAFGLAGWSLIDAVRYHRTGDAKKLTLGLPGPIKQRIHQVIRSGLKTRNLLIGSIGVGFLVAVLESVCTGQVYLPTIVLVARSPALRAHALAYLLLYNLMFILPLVGILVLAYLGIRSESLGQFLRDRLLALKLAMAGLFGGLGIPLLITL